MGAGAGNARWHVLNTFLSSLFLRGVFLLLLLDRLHVHRAKVLIFWEISVEGVGWMYGIIFFCRVFASVFEYDLWAAWVLWLLN
jgi:hypothetical protein